jgi:hypothetical protein
MLGFWRETSRRRWAFVIWAVILVVIGARLLHSPRANGVYPIFSNAGRQWAAGQSVYGQSGVVVDVFRYSPPAAAFFAPWALLPDQWGGLIWRGLSAAVFLGGLAAWCRWQQPARSFATVSLLVLPLAVGGLNNGQCNALIIGSLLLAQVAFAREFWTAAAMLVIIPALFKGYPLSFGMLLCLIGPRRFAPRLAVCLLVMAAVPYLFQRADYVTAQYGDFWWQLGVDDRTDMGAHGYRDLQMLAIRAGVPMSLATYRLTEAALGLACAAAVLAGRRRGWDKDTTLSASLSLALCWMTLAGPATESTTYVLISPLLAMAVLTIADRPQWQKCTVGASFVLFVVAACVVWFPGSFAKPIQATGIQPFAALLLTIHVLAECWRAGLRRTAEREIGADTPLAA